MRILHVVSTAKRRGAEIFAADLVRLLAGAGVAQRVAVLVASAPFDVQYGGYVSVLSEETGGHRLGWLRRVVALRRQVSAWRPDVVFAHGGDALKHSVAADPRGRVPLVYRNIGMAGGSITRGARRRLYSTLMCRADKVVAVADVVARQTVVTFRVSPASVVTMPNGVDGDRLMPVHEREAVRREIGVPAGAPVVLSVGALSWEKDPLEQVELAARLLVVQPECVFVLVGDGPLRPDVEAMVCRRGLEGRVLLLGSRGDVADLLGAGDVLVLTSRSDGMEGMPASVIEAGLAGLPVVAYRVAGLGEVVDDGVTGLLVPPGDMAALVDATRCLVADGRLRAQFGRRARIHCMERFELHEQLPRYLELCTEVAGKTRSC
ncbi:MAG: glycosyltransferase [Acidimicrobiales bacterium]